MRAGIARILQMHHRCALAAPKGVPQGSKAALLTDCRSLPTPKQILCRVRVSGQTKGQTRSYVDSLTVRCLTYGLTPLSMRLPESLPSDKADDRINPVTGTLLENPVPDHNTIHRFAVISASATLNALLRPSEVERLCQLHQRMTG